MTTYETQIWPMIRAKWDGGKRTGEVNWVVIHAMDALEGPTTAEGCGRDFATRGENEKASSHIGVDSDSIVQYVPDSYIAYAAPPANAHGIQVELAGYSSQTRAQWLDAKSVCTLALGADAVAQYCLKYSVPPVHLTTDELRASRRGIVGHYQVSAVWKQSDHTDPGEGFPWDLFIGMVTLFMTVRRALALNL